MDAADFHSVALTPPPISPPLDNADTPNYLAQVDASTTQPVAEPSVTPVEELATTLSNADTTEQYNLQPADSAEEPRERVHAEATPAEQAPTSQIVVDHVPEITQDEEKPEEDVQEVDAQAAESAPQPPSPRPPTPPAKVVEAAPPPPRRDSMPAPLPLNGSAAVAAHNTGLRHGNHVSGRQTPPSRPSSAASHRRSLTVSRGKSVSSVLITSALETISASKEAKRSAPLRESVHRALELAKSGQGGDRPREIFEPLRLACETRNEKLMVASLDCISKLISYSFFVENTDSQPLPSPPPSPAANGRHSISTGSNVNLPAISLVDVVVHTITSCHSETTPDPVSLQIVKALLALVLSSTILVHGSSLLKAVRTVYNVFLLSSDPVNQTVAQGGLTQMVNHVFSRVNLEPSWSRSESTTTLNSRPDVPRKRRSSIQSSRNSMQGPPQSPPATVRVSSLAGTDYTSSTLVNGDLQNGESSQEDYGDASSQHAASDHQDDHTNGYAQAHSYSAP